MDETDLKEYRRRRRLALIAVAAATGAITAAVMYALFYIKLPYYIFGPGSALDLNGVIAVRGHTPPPGSLFLTDVDVLPGRPAYYAAAKLLPGFEIVRRDDVAPPTMSDAQLDTALIDDMKQSQVTAEVVAERAAGLPVVSSAAVVVERVLRHTPASRCLKPDDHIVAVDGAPVTTLDAVTDAAKSRPAGTRFTFALLRGKARVVATCATTTIQGTPRFGMMVGFDPGSYRVPVPVKYDIHDINGSSAGLMFALQIYRTLTGRDLGAARLVAGTGVLEVNGRVDPIEGAREKLEAAKRAGATVFLIPVQNYRDVKGTAGIRIIPVRSFSDALAALSATQQPE